MSCHFELLHLHFMFRIAFIATLIRCILLVDSREEFLWLWILDTIILLLNAYHFASFALQTCLYLILKFFYLPTFGHCLKIHAKYCSTSKMAIQCILEKNAIVQKLFRLESSTPKTCCNLQQLEFNSLRNNILQLRSMSETLFTQYPFEALKVCTDIQIYCLIKNSETASCSFISLEPY